MKEKKSRQPKAMPTTHALSAFITWSKEMLLVLACVLLINSFVMAAFEVPTGSMEDTVEIGDRLFVNKFIYGGSTPYTLPLTSIRIPHLRLPGLRDIQRGDVVVFDWPGGRDQAQKPKQIWYLKRCIGLPGDTVRIDGRIVYVNGQKIDGPRHVKFLNSEPAPADFSNPRIFPRGSGFNADHYGPIVVPHKGMKVSLSAENLDAWEVFIRREGHSIARIGSDFGIDGGIAKYYTVERNYIFAMGDNRDDSLDSRFWGFIPVEDVVGTPMFVYWSWDPEISLLHPIDKLRTIKLRRIGTIIR
jgi:signal peptidase I